MAFVDQAVCGFAGNCLNFGGAQGLLADDVLVKAACASLLNHCGQVVSGSDHVHSVSAGCCQVGALCGHVGVTGLHGLGSQDLDAELFADRRPHQPFYLSNQVP